MANRESEITSQVAPLTAAGAVLWRAGAAGRREIALVHRPRYDDWSFPKGKVHAGETSQYAAVREVAEETGFSCVLSQLLTRANYRVHTQSGEPQAKLVDYFCARARSGFFSPNAEVDELLWLSPEHARQRLSYPEDAHTLDLFEGLPADTTTLLLVRHAKAGKRSEWFGADHLRPLSTAGQRQSAALRSILPLFGPERVYSAPRLRCEQTVAPVAEDLGLTIGTEPLLSEEGYWPNPLAGVDRLLNIAAGTGPAVVSSQGGVIPDLVARLSHAGGFSLGEAPSRKASVWTLTFRRDAHSPNGGGPALRLSTAHYLDDPLATGPLAADRLEVEADPPSA